MGLMRNRNRNRNRNWNRTSPGLPGGVKPDWPIEQAHSGPGRADPLWSPHPNQ